MLCASGEYSVPKYKEHSPRVVESMRPLRYGDTLHNAM